MQHLPARAPRGWSGASFEAVAPRCWLLLLLLLLLLGTGARQGCHGSPCASHVPAAATGPVVSYPGASDGAPASSSSRARVDTDPIFPFSGQYSSIVCPRTWQTPSQSCSRRGNCIAGTNCTWSLRGVFKNWDPAPEDQCRRTCPAHPCKDTDVEGKFVSGTHWRPNTCGLAWLRPQDIYQCLRGRRILFLGDSMTRQLYHRLVHYMRGLTSVIEHKYHNTSLYTHNGTHDTFSLFPPGDSQAPQFIPRGLRRGLSGPAASLMEVAFMWEQKSLPSARIIEPLQPDIIVASIIYHIETELPWAPEALDGLAKGGAPTVKALYWLTTPLMGEAEGRSWNKARLARNALMRAALVQRNRDAWRRAEALRRGKGGKAVPGSGAALNGSVGFGSSTSTAALLRYYNFWQVVPFDKMHEQSPFERRDRMHYQCSYEPPRPGIKPSTHFSKPPTKDCRDLMNLNLLQLLLSHVCCTVLAE